VSRTPAAELARLKVVYQLWAVSRMGGEFAARTYDEFGLVVLIRDTPGALEGEMMQRIGRRSKSTGAS
jgi:hypothetical protein